MTDQNTEFEAFIQQEAAHDGSGKPVNRLWAMRLARALLAERARADKAEAGLADVRTKFSAFKAFEALASKPGNEDEPVIYLMALQLAKLEAELAEERALIQQVKSAALVTGLE
jgi:hypothetical protein